MDGQDTKKHKKKKSTGLSAAPSAVHAPQAAVPKAEVTGTKRKKRKHAELAQTSEPGINSLPEPSDGKAVSKLQKGKGSLVAQVTQEPDKDAPPASVEAEQPRKAKKKKTTKASATERTDAISVPEGVAGTIQASQQPDSPTAEPVAKKRKKKHSQGADAQVAVEQAPVPALVSIKEAAAAPEAAATQLVGTHKTKKNKKKKNANLQAEEDDVPEAPAAAVPKLLVPTQVIQARKDASAAGVVANGNAVHLESKVKKRKKKPTAEAVEVQPAHRLADAAVVQVLRLELLQMRPARIHISCRLLPSSCLDEKCVCHTIITLLDYLVG